ncbi:MAG: lysophospholipid acyltransferase family protein [Paracoccaceae bacterium]
MSDSSAPSSFQHRLEDIAARALLGSMRLLPYGPRVRLMGWIFARIVAPLAGYDQRVRDNLAYVRPDLPQAEVARLARAVPNNVGRTLIEMYSGQAFMARMAKAPLEGPGCAALLEAHEAGRPVIVVTGHFGNYLAPRAALAGRGMEVGGLYNPMKNPFFNGHYVNAMRATGETLFARDRSGFARLLKSIRAGGMAGLLIDQYMGHGAPLTFFGKPAPTALSAAELALKYNAPLIPIYGIRQANGLDFKMLVEAPIPIGTPEEMTQAANDSLEALTRKHMEQWFWIHRRWKPERTSKST